MTQQQESLKSSDRIPDSATGYRNVSFTGGEYAPARPFKGLQVETAGDIEIVGIDGTKTVLSGVTAGDHAYAGLKIIEANTTATGITALF